MSTTLLAIPDAEVTIKWRQPYVSEALNRKLSVVPRGVVRGFVPTGDPVNPDTIILVPDPSSSDSVVNGSGPPASGSGDYFVTWRVLTSQSFSIAVDGNLHFIYFVPGYASGATTVPTVMDYTQAEYEAGVPRADGGVLICVVQANGVAGLIPSEQLLMGGCTNNAYTPFVRETAQSTAGGSHSDGGGEEAVVLFCGFSPATDRGAVFVNGRSMDRSLGSSVSFDTTTFETGTASLHFVKGTDPVSVPLPAEARLTKSFPLWREDVATIYPKKLRVAMRFKVNATYNLAAPVATFGNGALVKLWATDGSDQWAGNAALAGAPPNTYAPTSGAEVNNATKSTNWTWLVYEFEVPPTIGGIPVASASLNFCFGDGLVANSEMWVDRVLVTLSRENLTSTGLIDRSTNPQTSGNGAVGSATDALFFSSRPGATAGAFLFDGISAAPNILRIVGELGGGRIQIGRVAFGATNLPNDPVVGTTTARYSVLDVLGNGTGWVGDGIQTTNASIRATGSGGNVTADHTVTGNDLVALADITAGSDITGSGNLTLDGVASTLNATTDVNAAVRATQLQLGGAAFLSTPETMTVQLTDNTGVPFTRTYIRDIGHSKFLITESSYANQIGYEYIMSASTTDIYAQANLNDFFGDAGFDTLTGVAPRITGLTLYGITDDATLLGENMVGCQIQRYEVGSVAALPTTVWASSTITQGGLTRTGAVGTTQACSVSFPGFPWPLELSTDYNVTLLIACFGGAATRSFGLRFARFFIEHSVISA